MAEPRVLVLGDSFVRRLRLFVSCDSHHFSVDFKLSHHAFIKWHRVGGRTVSKTLHFDLNVIESFRPEIATIQLGSNDLTDSLTLYMLAQLLMILLGSCMTPMVLRLSACARPSCARAQWSLIVRPSC